MGHRSDYLAIPHTRKWFRQENYFPSEVIDRGSYDAWQQKGSKTSVQRAADKVENNLRNYNPVELPEVVKDELKSITTRAARSFGMDSLPALPE
jgi:trimethylamine:corrinoid methyltransferase-like protein